MSQVYAVAESAHAEMARLRAQLLSAVKHRRLISDGPLLVLATSESVKRIYNRRLGEIIGQSYQLVDGDRTVAVQCPACRKVEIIKGDVVRFHCVCSPSVTRFAHQCRSIDLTAAIAAKE